MKVGSEVAQLSAGSPERFGYEWGLYSSILPEHEEQFRRWLPFYSPEDWVNKRFIDVGCGMGRNSFWPLSYGAAGAVAIDVDERSLTAARNNLSCFNGVRVVRGSAYDLSWRDEFDIAFSIGVIHHLENPNVALAEMVKVIKPGGQVAIWVYGRENNEWLLKWLDPTRKLLFSHLPPALVHFIAGFPTALLWLLLRSGWGRLPYFKLLRQFSFGHLRSIVFDQLLPQTANYWTRSEVEGLMRNTGLEKVEIVSVNGMSWAARGVKV